MSEALTRLTVLLYREHIHSCLFCDDKKKKPILIPHGFEDICEKFLREIAEKLNNFDRSL